MLVTCGRGSRGVSGPPDGPYMQAIPYIRLDTHTDNAQKDKISHTQITFSRMDVNENIHPTEQPDSSPSASARAREVGTEQDTLG